MVPFVGSLEMRAGVDRHRLKPIKQRHGPGVEEYPSMGLPPGFAADATVSPPSQASPKPATPARNAPVFGGDKSGDNGDNRGKLRRVEPDLK
jgi:hypothetical protein